jgi:hypothetical protein
MFNFLQGGIKNKGRFFKKVTKQGGNLMKGKVFLTLALLCALMFAGWSCSHKTAAPTDTNIEPETPTDVNEAPAEWKEYKNEEWGFGFQYPGAWDLRVVKSNPFDWNENHYELVEIQLRGVGSDDYVGEYSFAIASNPSHLSTREWLMSNNNIGESLELRDTAINSALAGIEIRGLASEIRSPDERAFPGVLAFSDPEKNYVFFPELGQEHVIFRDYNTTPDEFEKQILNTLNF